MPNAMTYRPTSEAVRYAFAQLAVRAGLPESTAHVVFSGVGISAEYTDTAVVASSHPSLVVRPAGEERWERLLDLDSNTLDWVSVDQLLPSGTLWSYAIEKLPVLFWSSGYDRSLGRPIELQSNNMVVWHIDIVATALFMLTRWEETIVPTRDQHDRFPATASVAYKQGFLDRPIVDEYALILQAWLKVLRPGWTPQPRRFSVKLSHDIDFVRSASWRQLGGDLLKRRSLTKAVQTFHELGSPEKDPYLRGCYELADLSEQHGLQSAFYFMAAEPSPFDNGYDIQARPVQRAIQRLRRRGHEIGFHPGYRTLNSPECFLVEKQRMDKALGEKHYGGRQHFLRFHAPDTWRLWEQVGLAYDSTLGYADHEGFRSGTCHPYHPFDIGQDRQLDLLEIPLIVMEVTLKRNRGLTPEEGEQRILTLAERCEQVNGVFTLLWHNTSLQGEWEPWATIYRRVLSRLARMEGRTRRTQADYKS